MRVAADPDELRARIEALVRSGRKIDAIRVYREATGTSLVDAKNAVEAVEAGQPMPQVTVMSPPSVQGDLAKVHALAAAGHRLEAIKVYREQSGSSLAEAKAYVEKLPLAGGASGIAELERVSQGPVVAGFALVVVLVVLALVLVALGGR